MKSWESVKITYLQTWLVRDWRPLCIKSRGPWFEPWPSHVGDILAAKTINFVDVCNLLTFLKAWFAPDSVQSREARSSRYQGVTSNRKNHGSGWGYGLRCSIPLYLCWLGQARPWSKQHSNLLRRNMAGANRAGMTVPPLQVLRFLFSQAVAAGQLRVDQERATPHVSASSRCRDERDGLWNPRLRSQNIGGFSAC